MPRTISAPWLARLALEEAGEFVELYEFTLPSGVQYWARGAVTWNAQAYDAYVSKRSDLSEEIGGEGDGLRVTLINVDGVVRDFINDGEFQDAKFKLWIAETTGDTRWLLFEGRCTNPQDANQRHVEVEINGLVELLKRTPCPKRMTCSTCPWVFGPVATGLSITTPCGYAGPTTTANGSGSGSTTLTPSSMTKFVSARHRMIQIGAGDPVKITGKSATTLTLESARTWSNADEISFVNCRGTFTDCQDSDREFEYGGLRGFRDVKDRIFGPLNRQRPGAPPGWLGMGLHRPFEIGLKLKAVNEAVPLVYGRRLVTAIPVEFNHYSQDNATGRGKNMVAAFYLLSAGLLQDSPSPFVKAWVGGRKRALKTASGGGYDWVVAGTFYRLGDEAIDDTETFADYDVDPTTEIRTQNIDFRGSTGTAYNHLAYAIYTAPADADIWDRQGGDSAWKVPEFIQLMDGRLVQHFDAAGDPDGDPLPSDNPIWCMVDIATSTLHGVGIDAAYINFTNAKASADYCAIEILSVESDTTVTTGGTASHIHVVSAAGYRPGDPVYVNGVDSTETVVQIKDAGYLEISGSITTAANDRIYTKVPRFECNVILDQRDTAYEQLQAIMAGCRGYLTTTGGQFHFFVDRDA